MKHALFLGCNIPIRIPQYATALQAVCRKFSVELVEVADFNCCGYPARNVDEKAYLLPSVRNLAIAEKMGLDLVVICNCCFASLRKAAVTMRDNPDLRASFNAILAKENLHYAGEAKIRHYLSLLYEEVGVERIRQALTRVFSGLNIAIIHGCHLLRPRRVTGFDDAFVPKIADELLQLCGAASLDWPGKMECCGAALAGINDSLAARLLNEKVAGALAAGADFISPVCAYCHLQFDTAQLGLKEDEARRTLPVLLYPQLLGLCLGCAPESLGIDQNRTITPADLQGLTARLAAPAEKPKKRAPKKVAASVS
jgi:heterodisulfide reductase subunit B